MYTTLNDLDLQYHLPLYIQLEFLFLPTFRSLAAIVSEKSTVFRALTRILKIGVKMAHSRNSWNFSIHLYWDFSKSWSQIQKVGVNYSKFGVNETSGFHFFR